MLTRACCAPDLFIVGRAETDDAERKLLRAGADRVLSPYQIGAVQMAQTALRPAVVDFVELATSSGNLELAMEQIRIATGSALADRSLVDANLRQRFSVIVVGIQRSGAHMEFNPAAGRRDAARRQARRPRSAGSSGSEQAAGTATRLTRIARSRSLANSAAGA